MVMSMAIPIRLLRAGRERIFTISLLETAFRLASESVLFFFFFLCHIAIVAACSVALVNEINNGHLVNE